MNGEEKFHRDGEYITPMNLEIIIVLWIYIISFKDFINFLVRLWRWVRGQPAQICLASKPVGPQENIFRV